MAGIQALGDAVFEDLVANLTTIAWPVPMADMPSLVEGWGWAVTWIADDGDALEADPGFGLEVVEAASLDALDGELTTVRVSTSDRVDGSKGTRTELRDAYAEQVAVARNRLGEPASRKPGKLATVTWTLANGSRVDLVCGENSCWITATSPTHTSARRVAGR